MQQAADFRDESLALAAVLETLAPEVYGRPTQFKGWTIDDILQHLHYFNVLAHLSLVDPDGFDAEWAALEPDRGGGDNLVAAVAARLPADLRGPPLLTTWRGFLEAMTADFAAADPKARLRWAGPDMSARSSITARLMETWAHGQEIYDLLGLERVDHDRIRNIAHLGVSTFGWTHQNRGEPVPPKVPYVRLTAPSGAIWEWGMPGQDERIEGPATGFCQVVCQTRNIADVALAVTGPVATHWMAVAQCFAGPPRTPPAPGTRCRAGAAPA